MAAPEQSSSGVPDLERWLNARESSALVQSETASRDGTLRWVAEGRAEAYRDVLNKLAALSPPQRDPEVPGNSGRVEEGLPPELAKALRDPTITIDRDQEITLPNGQTLAEHLEEWRNAPSNTVSGATSTQPSSPPPEPPGKKP